MQKILVIDDDALFRETIAAALRNHSFEIIEAENGRAGVRLAQEHLPDLILSDVQMESFDGYAALAAIRYQPTTSVIPMILMTGNPDETGRRLAMEIGADDYLAKPFSINSLLATVRMQLKKSEGIRQQALLTKPSDRDRAEVKALAETSIAATSGSGKPHESASPAAAITPAISGGQDLGDSELPALDVTAENVDLTVEVFLRMLGAYHPNLLYTARRAMALCNTLGVELALSAAESDDLIRAAALCDIALVGARHEVVRRWLRSPHTLEKGDLVQIRQHPEQSQRMLESWPVLDGAAGIIRSHHEKWDGSGFPDGLKADQIPWLARVLAVVNSFCSRHDSGQAVLAEMELQSRYAFDPDAIAAVAKAVPKVVLPGGKREILVTELRGGLVLAQDLYNTEGTVLLPEGRTVTDGTVARLMAINRSRPMTQTVLVYS